MFGSWICQGHVGEIVLCDGVCMRFERLIPDHIHDEDERGGGLVVVDVVLSIIYISSSSSGHEVDFSTVDGRTESKGSLVTKSHDKNIIRSH